MPKHPDFDRKFRAVLTDAFDDLVRLHADAIEVRISESWPPASTVGNPPHSRTGELRDNIKIEGPSLSGTEIEAKILSERPSTPEVPSILESPTGLDRPYMTIEALYLQDEGPRELASLLTAKGIAADVASTGL